MSSLKGLPSNPRKQEQYNPYKNPIMRQQSSQPRWIPRRLLIAQANSWKIWVLKQSQAPHKSASTKQVSHQTRTTSKSSLPKPITTISEKIQTKQAHFEANPMVMRLQALQLQVKIFGLTSMMLHNHDWLSYVRQQQGYTLLLSNKEQWKNANFVIKSLQE